MRWSTIRLIAARELRDLLRDRRWLALLLGVPVLLYPAFGLFGFAFALATLDQTSAIGIVGANHLPGAPPANRDLGPSAELGWLTALPVPGSNMLPDVAAAAVGVSLRRSAASDPPLIVDGEFAREFCESAVEQRSLRIFPLASAEREALVNRQFDVLLVVPAGFHKQIAADATPAIELDFRDGDDFSKLAGQHVNAILGQYRRALKLARFARVGLPANFDRIFEVRDPDTRRPRIERTTNELRDALIHFVPFMLVMWSLAGALYPAIDLCAGEKERGTMETLLISPAERGEIVGGKFLAVATLSYSASLWNLIWMGGLAVIGGTLLKSEVMRPVGLLWCGVLALPLAALFAALCLALGAYARSTKEGQYYLLPIFLVSLPLVMISLAPGIELTWRTSLIPVTNVCLMIQTLMRPDGTVGWLIVPTLASLTVCVALALRWAVWQFHRESVLFRDVERPGLFDQLRWLLRDKHAKS